MAVVSAVNTASPLTFMVHVDHLNRPVRMTNAARATVWDAIWLPWGGVHAITGTETLNARFPGQWFHLETGLHYNWHRSYDPTLGRYTQPDPLGFVDGPNVYAYALGSPQRFVDRDGRFVFPPTPGPVIVRPNPGPLFPVPPTMGPSGQGMPDSPFVMPERPSNFSDHAYYKRICTLSVPPEFTKDPCMKALWELGRNRACLAGRTAEMNSKGESNWQSVAQAARALKNSEDDVKKHCGGASSASYMRGAGGAQYCPRF